MSNFAALGQRLRDAREAKELSPEEVERATRIRARFIEQLERGDFSGMTPVQAQGFLRNYARFLGIDFDLLETELTGQESKPRAPRGRRETKKSPSPATPVPTPAPRPAARPEGAPRRRRGWLTSTLIILLAGAIVVLVVLGATALLNSISRSAEEDEGAGAVNLTPEPGDVTPDDGEGELAAGDPSDPDAAPGEGTPDPSAAQSDTPLTPELAYTPPGDTTTSVVVSVNVTQRTWLRVTVDGEITQEGLARPGEVWQFEGQESVGLRASNAAALQLSVNNQRQGTLGGRGQLFDQTFTREGVAGPPPEEPASEAGAQDAEAPDAGAFTPTPDTPVAASPEEAALVLSSTLDPNASLPTGLEDGIEGIARLPASITPELPTSEPDGEPATAARPPTAEPVTDTPMPSSTPEPPTDTPLPPPTLTPLPSETPSPTASPTATVTPGPPTLTPLPSETPSPTATLTATTTPTPTPFLPPRMTRTPTVSPK